MFRRAPTNVTRIAGAVILFLLFCLAFGATTLLISGCAPLAFSGANKPTEHTFELTPEDLEEAARLDCEQAWFTGDPAEDIATAFDRLSLASVDVVYRNPIAGGTAGQSRLYLARNFPERPPQAQARLLRHELTHYCDRKRLGDATFERRYAHSAGRWVLEVRADVQQVRGFRDQGASAKDLRAWIDKEISTMRDVYWLWDIDPEQYEAETRRILLEAVDL